MSASEPEGLRGRTFKSRSLRGTRFVGCDLGDVVVRGSDVAGMEIDSPWLLEGASSLLVNGVDVVPLVEAELSRRFPGRALRAAEDPEGLRAAWAALERTWAATVDRATAMPVGTLDASIDGEWSLAETLRHLVMSTDTWLGKGILGQEQPYHPAGLPHDDNDSAAYDDGVFSAPAPSFAEVMEARSDRQTMVREFLAAVTPELLAQPRKNPHAPDHEETVLSCLRTILEEEWEHHRYAVRDLDVISTARPAAEWRPPSPVGARICRGDWKRAAGSDSHRARGQLASLRRVRVDLRVWCPRRIIATLRSISTGVVRGTGERTDRKRPSRRSPRRPKEMTEMFTIEDDSGTYTGPVPRHNGYYAGDFTRNPMRTASELSALAKLRPLASGPERRLILGRPFRR